MAQEPRAGDAFGEILRAALAERNGSTRSTVPSIGPRTPRPVVEIVERDDGYIRGAPAAWYLAQPEEWWPSERHALERIDGVTLDVGAGGGRLSLALQERDVPVTALDPSPGAIEVAQGLGVRSVVLGTVEEHIKTGNRYDTFALFGNNLGLLGPQQNAPHFLSALAALARPQARIIGQGTDPHYTTDPRHLAYHERNRAQGKPPGLYRQRVRFLDLTTPYLEYLLCSPQELADLVKGTEWEIVEVDYQDAPIFFVTLSLRQ